MTPKPKSNKSEPSGASAPGAAMDTPADPPRFSPVTTGGQARDYLDELVFIFVIVMFMKLFICELYKIPSGSMTPTLLGGSVIHEDVDNDNRRDIVYMEGDRRLGYNRAPHVYLRQENGRYVYDATVDLSETRLASWINRKKLKPQFDRILVNKQAYWFKDPRRGDIVIFKVPDPPYRPEAPIYIKRLTGEPGDTLSFTHDGRLIANGKLVTEPDFFTTQRYVPEVEPRGGFVARPTARIQNLPSGKLKLLSLTVPEDEAYVFGDNAHASLDSRYWGGVPLEHFKGRAFLRVWPVFQFTFLE